MHFASFEDNASTCKLLCALDGVDQNAVDNEGKTAFDRVMTWSMFDSVRVLLDLNVDTSEVRVTADTNVELVRLLEEQRKRSVKQYVFVVGIIVFDVVFFSGN